MSESPQNKRKYSETGITPTKITAFKTSKILEDTECEETVAKMDTLFLRTLSTLMPKLLDQSSVTVLPVGNTELNCMQLTNSGHGHVRFDLTDLYLMILLLPLLSIIPLKLMLRHKTENLVILVKETNL